MSINKYRQFRIVPEQAYKETKCWIDTCKVVSNDKQLHTLSHRSLYLFLSLLSHQETWSHSFLHLRRTRRESIYCKNRESLLLKSFNKERMQMLNHSHSLLSLNQSSLNCTMSKLFEPQKLTLKARGIVLTPSRMVLLISRGHTSPCWTITVHTGRALMNSSSQGQSSNAISKISSNSSFLNRIW